MRIAREVDEALRSAAARRARASFCILTSVLSGALAAALHARSPQERANPLTTWTVTVVLPPKLMAGHPATLAVLGVDGKLAPGVRVDLSDGESLTTDRTGRAVFTVPAAGDYLLVKGSGASAAALIDPAVAESEPKAITLPPVVSTQDRFWICGAGLRGEADANTVKINGKTALVMAASPTCLVALAAPETKPGPALLSIEAPGVQWSATTTLVSLEFEPPSPALKPGARGQLAVRVRGSNLKLGIAVQNRTPGVLRFARGDVQELVTNGGAQNLATIRVQALTSGDFSFGASLLPARDAGSAARYLRAAAALAPQELQREIGEMARDVERRPRDVEKQRAELRRISQGTIAGDFRTLLDAALAAL